MAIRNEIILNSLRELVARSYGVDISNIQTLKADSSNRKIFRIHVKSQSVVGVYNENIPENISFTGFTHSFHKAGLPVPEIISVSDDNMAYLMSDLGDDTLFKRAASISHEARMQLYEESLQQLVRFQTVGKECIDFSICHFSSQFDAGVIRADIEKLNDYFLNRLAGFKFPAERIAKVIEILSEITSQNNRGNFMYRDFQPRNIMVTDEGLRFLDYQSGMKGPSLYDLASFVYSGSIDISDKEREQLSIAFRDYSADADPMIDGSSFMEKLPVFGMLRTLQVLGSYAFVNQTKNDTEILKKIPPALKRLLKLSDNLVNNELKEFAREVAGLGTKSYS